MDDDSATDFGKKRCMSLECNFYARVLHDSVDPNADPCDDFFNYACGKKTDVAGSEDLLLLKEKETFSTLGHEVTAKMELDSPWKVRTRQVYDRCLSSYHNASDQGPIMKELLALSQDTS